VQWTANGVPLCTESDDQRYPLIVSDGAGGAIVAWQDDRGTTPNIYAQRINASGTTLWATDGVVICGDDTSVWDGISPELISYGAGDAIVTWQDSRGSGDIYAQRISSSGLKQWPSSGALVCTDAGSQQAPQIINDGSGGAVITWRDARGGTSDIYAQRINASGTGQWTANGITICSAALDQTEPCLAPDGAGGAVIAWSDNRGGSSDIYAQRVSGTGAALWTTNGVAVSTATGTQEHPRIIDVEAGRAVVAWNDARNGCYDIYAQKTDADGSGLWSADGTPVCVISGYALYPSIASDGVGGAITTWSDYRIGTAKVYAQRVERNGYWGFPAPLIADARDLPGDQGGFVDLAWYASRLDPYPDELIDQYTVWRGINHAGAALMAEAGAIMLEDPAMLDPAAERPVIRMERTAAGETYFWKLISTVDAYHLGSYEEVVPTLFDSTAACTEYQYFQVIAHVNATGQYWISTPDSGYSVDNLSPAPPVGLAAEQEYVPAGLNLTWDPNGEADLDHYAVYRGTSVDFVPGLSNIVASPKDTTCFDGDWRWDTGYYYKVSALDIHGNESDFALLEPIDVTGDDTPKAPEASYLAQNFPNPFNPTTRIAFGLNRQGSASLRVYDAAGRLVRTLMDRDLKAGRYEVAWNGADGAGHKVASGLYFYRLSAGGLMETRKMILLR